MFLMLMKYILGWYDILFEYLSNVKCKDQTQHDSKRTFVLHCPHIVSTEWLVQAAKGTQVSKGPIRLENTGQIAKSLSLNSSDTHFSKPRLSYNQRSC